MPRAVFDRLTAEADPLVRAGEHAQDAPPVDGGRWPVTFVCRPRAEAARRMDDEMRALLPYAGSDHFRTGRADSVHLTVRALEPYREGAHPDESVVCDWRTALARTAARQPPFTLDCTGLALTSGGVMAQLEARDEQPWSLMATLREELGVHAWYEDQWGPRDIWYATLVHFAGPLDDPDGLVERTCSLGVPGTDSPSSSTRCRCVTTATPSWAASG